MIKRILCLLVILIVLFTVLPVLAESEPEVLTIPGGQSQLLKIAKVQRVAVADPAVAEVVVVSSGEVLINGGEPGVTTLHIWTDRGYQRYILRVYEDNSFTAEQVREAIGNPGVLVTKVKETIILKGMVETLHDKREVMEIAGSFGDKVVDLLTVQRPLQVRIQAYVVELNRDKLRELGLEWGELVRGVLQPHQLLFGQLDLNSLPARLNPLGAELKALEEQNVSRTLAAPEVVTLSGEMSEILVGGEIPLLKGGDIIWKPYGIILTVEPEVLSNGEIRITLEPEVSALDWDNALKVGDYEYPAFRTRRVKTTVTVMDGSTIVLGGLLGQEDVAKVKKVPFLGDLPIFGELFRSNQFRKGESELVVLVQTTLLDNDAAQLLYEEKRPFVEDQERRLQDVSRAVEEGD